MSKMPAKKKSCFQITSVTQAQVAQASSITDDTESLDDPDDQSRTEDVSSEIFDVSRADLMGVCDRSSSEETLNNVGEHQEGHQPASTGPVNGGFSVRSAGSGHVTPHLAGGVPVPTASQPSIPSSTTTTQPIVNSVPHHANVPTTVAQVNPVATSTTTTTTTCSSRFRVIKLDHGTGEPFRRGRWTCTEFYERDSEGSSMSRTVDSIKHVVVLDHNVDRDSGLGVTGGSVIIPSAGSAQESNADSGYSIAYHTHPPEPLQHGYTLVSQTGNGASAFQPTGYSTAVPQHPQQANMQPVVPQNLHPSGLNGAAHGAMLQKSPIMPPAQQYAYSTHGGGQLDYRQQQFAPLQPQGSNTQNHLPMASLSVGPPASQGPSPAISPAGPGAQGLGMVAQGGEASAASATATYNSVQNVPATVPSSNNIPPGMLNHTLSAGGLVQAQGAYGGALMMGLPVGFSMQAEDGGRKFDILPQPSAGALAVKDGMKPFISESGGLPTPTTVSIFGIPITIDGDEDSTSGASVVAIDNKIEQAMDLVKSHLMYAVREEVEVLKEQIKELYERNSMLERENAVLKSLANTEQLSQVSNQVSPAGSMSPPQQQILHHHPSAAAVNHNNNNSPNASLAQHDGGQTTAPPHQPNVTSA